MIKTADAVNNRTIEVRCNRVERLHRTFLYVRRKINSNHGRIFRYSGIDIDGK